MRRFFTFCSLAAACIFIFRQDASLALQNDVPRLVQFNGVIENSGGEPLQGVHSVTFALYKDQREGPALWQETHNVRVQHNGQFAALLGSETQGGLPAELFSGGQPRWIGVQVNDGRPEQPRVMLLSVPYALKAADAETLGGRPISDFVLAGSSKPKDDPNCSVRCSSYVDTGAIVDSDIHPSAAIVPSKIAGTAATLGANTFNGRQTINNGNLALPMTTSNGTAGVLTLGGVPFLHRFGGSNTFLGNQAGNMTLTGIANSVVGEFAMARNTTGHHSSVVGVGALFQNTTGSNNTASGASVLNSNTTGSDNTATGYYALAYNQTGTDNTAMGMQAIFMNPAGNGNTAMGSAAMQGLTSGSYNTAIGYRTLELNAAGSGNTAVGYGAGTAATSNFNGSNNTFIGNSTGAFGTGISGATAIGYGAQVAKSGAVILGSLSAVVGIGTQSPMEKLDVVGNIMIGDNHNGYGCVKERNGHVIGGYCSSDERLKRNIEEFEPVLEKLVRIRPVYFDWRTDEYPDLHLGSSRSPGLIAQDVEQALPDMVAEDAAGFKMVNYSQLPLLLLQAMREQQEQIRELRIQVEQLKAELGEAAR